MPGINTVATIYLDSATAKEGSEEVTFSAYIGGFICNVTMYITKGHEARALELLKKKIGDTE